MINNRLFKKINSIFWGIVSWMPVFLFLFLVISYSLTLDINSYGDVFKFQTFYTECISFVVDSTIIKAFFAESIFIDPLITFASFFIDLNFEIPSFFEFIFIQVNWYLLVQLIRLVIYVFMWFINFIYDLFDYLSLKRKEEN